MAGDVESIDVCVVGGGPSGIFAAYLLEAKGYQVTVFEREDSVGGKTVPPKDIDGSDMTRHILTPGMPTVLSVMSEVGFDKEVNSLQLPQRNVFDTVGGIFPEPSEPSPEIVALLLAYLGAVAPNTEIFRIAKLPSNENIPVELTVPFGEWLSQNNLSQLLPVFYNIITNYGYGFISQVPAIYILKYLPFDTFPTSEWRIFVYHTFLQQLAGSLSDVRTSTEVKKVNARPIAAGGALVRVESKIDSKTSRFRCTNTIFAFPQIADNMKIVNGRGKAQRNAVFNQVVYTRYYELLVSNLSSDKVNGQASYVQFFQPNISDDTPNIYFRPQNHGDVIVLINSGTTDRCEEELIQIVQDHIQLLWDLKVARSDVRFWKEHQYFPQVGTEAFNAFYNDVQSLQGENNIFYTGGLLNFELVDSSMANAKYLVETYF